MPARRLRLALGVWFALAALLAAPAGSAASERRGGKGHGPGKAPAAGVWDAQVLDVLDGDTIEVEYHGQPLRIRFFGVDAPEKAQEAGQDAKAFSTALLLGKFVTVEVTTADLHGRSVGIIRIGDKVANEELVANGWGWVYRTYCKREDFCKRLFQLEDEAREARRGLWQAENPTAPWDWRYVYRTVPPFAPPKRKGAPADEPAPAEPEPAPAPGPGGAPGKDAPKP